MEERHEASNSTDNTAVEGWMTRFQVAHHEKLPVDHPLMLSKLASLPSHAHPQQEWRDAVKMEYSYTGNAKTVTSDKQRMALTVTGQGPSNTQTACSMPTCKCKHDPKPLRMENHRKRTKAACCQMA